MVLLSNDITLIIKLLNLAENKHSKYIRFVRKWNGILKRLNQETNNVVEEINETLEEIRYFLADLREEQYLK